jgi:hypothetical protein
MGAKFNFIFLIINYLTILEVAEAKHFQSGVNLKNGNYYITIEDLAKEKMLSREYNSRSNYSGLFGFGWCSPLEQKLIPESKSQYQLIYCDKKIHISTSDVFEFQSTRTWQNLEFTKAGLLLSFLSQDGQRTELVYKDGLLTDVIKGQNFSLKFKYEPNKKRIQMITFNKSQLIYFTYDNLSLLKASRHSLFGSLNYQYDSFSNLTELYGAAGTVEHMLYDSKKDLLLERITSECVENFSYTSPHDATKLTVKTLRACRRSHKKAIDYEFRFKESRFGHRALSSLKITSKQMSFIIDYDLESGKILKNRRIKNDKDLKLQRGSFNEHPKSWPNQGKLGS